MKQIMDLIRSRRSVRTFASKDIPAEVLENLMTYADSITNPYGVPVWFKLLNAKEHGLSAPVISGGDWYIGGGVEACPHCAEAFGYSFETLVLYAQPLGLGTTWIGGTMNRGSFERAMGILDGEQMPCVTPLGYAADKMSLRETMMRKGTKADSRNAFEALFFDGSFAKPLTRERAGRLEQPLEAVRLGPSAVNKQPWRVVVTENAAHFYVKKVKGVPVAEMQKIDLGIALCHFDLVSKELGIETEFVILDSDVPASPDTEYIASYLIK